MKYRIDVDGELVPSVMSADISSESVSAVLQTATVSGFDSVAYSQLMVEITGPEPVYHNIETLGGTFTDSFVKRGFLEEVTNTFDTVVKESLGT